MIKRDVLLKDKYSDSVVYIEEVETHGAIGYCMGFGSLYKGGCVDDEEKTKLFRKMMNNLTFGVKPTPDYLLARFPQLKTNGYEEL